MHLNLVTRALVIALLSVLISACGAGAAFDKAKRINTVIAYDEFLREYADSEYVEEARELRERSHFNEAKNKNTVRAYMIYLRKYPTGRYALRTQAEQAIDRLRYEEATEEGTIRAYNRYLRQHPNGRFATQVHTNREKLLFTKAEQEFTLRAYDDYLSEYPNGKSAAKARSVREELFFAKVEQAFTLEAYNSYLSEHPEGRFTTKARSTHEKLLFEQAEKESTVAAYDSYLSRYPNGKFVIQAHKIREKLLFAQAEQASTFAAYEQYLKEYPEGIHVAAAYERLDVMKRTIVWSSESNLTSDFTPLLTTQKFAANELKELPLHYFVYLYTQASMGQHLILHASARPLPSELPTQPELSKGEFESSKNFEKRSKKALDDWQTYVNRINTYYESRLAYWQESIQNYKDKLAQLKLQAQNPNRVFDRQQRAVLVALSGGFSLDSFQYDADNELFSYSISSRQFADSWQGKLSVPITQAQRFKTNLENISNLQLNFYLNPTGKLELRRIVDLDTRTSAETQSITSQPDWLPSTARLAQLDLHELSLSSNVHADQVTIDGIDYGPTPLTLELTPREHIVSISRHGYKDYSRRLDIRRNDALQIELEHCPQCSKIFPQMVYIPAGSFRMGDIQGGGDSDEKPVHRVSVKAFLMSQTEVTFAQWDDCVVAGGCSYRPYDKGWSRDNRPVTKVSWEDINEQYIPWLNKITGEQYRLPTEAEWEYAVRAGSETKYFFGNASNDMCQYGNAADLEVKKNAWRWTDADVSGWAVVDCNDGYYRTAPVASFAANAFGLYDMHGNVQEWTQDCWNDSYSNAPSNGSAWLSGDCDLRVLRGGDSWSGEPSGLRSANRHRYTADGRDLGLGFRLARTLD